MARGFAGGCAVHCPHGGTPARVRGRPSGPGGAGRGRGGRGAAGEPGADDATLPPPVGDTELVVVRAMDTGQGAPAAIDAEADAQATIDAGRAPGGALGGYVLGELLGRGGM